MSMERITVTIPGDVAEELRSRAENGHVPSVSAYVTRAVRTELSYERATAQRDAWLTAAGRAVPGPEHAAWGRALFILSAAGRHDDVQLLLDRAAHGNYRIDDILDAVTDAA